MNLFVPDLIRRKRDGGVLEDRELRALVRAYTDGDVPDYQMSAMLMAILFKGLAPEELAAWTDAMVHSGSVMDHSRVSKRKVDKHSTGGVGDKISLCLAPAVASLGVAVPMVSGRGLGHTGGTLDKLEAIPGFTVGLPLDRARSMLEDLGLFLIGQTDDVAPADRKLYALRDVTGTVESIPLIASSIMSKKIAEGIDGLVLDVKVGAGAFMRDLEAARELARTLVGIGEAAGKRVRALLTDMNNPIGAMVGNALEVREAIDVMRGGGPADTRLLTVQLGAEMLLLGEAFDDASEAREAMERTLDGGDALALFAKVVEAQGGDPGVCDDPGRLPAASGQEAVSAPSDGFVAGIEPRSIARAAMEVGAGRRVKEDMIDPATGVELHVRIGERVSAGQRLATIHNNGVNQAEARDFAREAFEISPERPEPPGMILDRI